MEVKNVIVEDDNVLVFFQIGRYLISQRFPKTTTAQEMLDFALQRQNKLAEAPSSQTEENFLANQIRLEIEMEFRKRLEEVNF
jgi:hypothetical protein